MHKKSIKNIISVIVVFVLAFTSFGALFASAYADEYSINLTGISQPNKDDGKFSNYALKINFDVKGYGGTKLRFQLCDSDGYEVCTILSSELVSDNTRQPYYLSGKNKNGKVLKDGYYYVSAWIEGSRGDTEQTESYYIDFKGNDTVSKSYNCIHLGQPNNPDSKYYDYALHAKFKVTGYKGKTFKVNLYDQYGNYLQTTTFKIGSNDYTANAYYDGYDDDGYWTGDGKYKVTAWIVGEDYSKSWADEVELKY